MRGLKQIGQNILGAAFVMLTVAVTPLRAQDDKSSSAKYNGMQGCAICHGQLGPNAAVLPEFALMNESALFSNDDKHAIAYKLLLAEGGLGQRMAAKLKIAKLSEAQQCLTCHAGTSARDPRTPEPEFPDSGVSCETCHGPSSEWDGPHRKADFRAKPIEDKIKLGMNDVRDPMRRAQLCYSCHIGNADEGRVVTHEMYAAGHPPLPSIEVETFIAAMPTHSRTFQEKGDFKFRKEYIAANHIQDVTADAMPRTKGVLVGGIMALSRSLELYAKKSGPAQGTDFAMFDCQACHHELRVPTWRQTRSRVGRPGRPHLPEWPTVLAGVAVAQLDPKAGSELQAKLDALARAMSARPFGGSDEVQKLITGTDGLLAWLEIKAKALVGHTLVKKEADQALTALYNLGAADIYDFHSARQIAWAIRAIETETHLKYPTFPPYVDGQPLSERRAQVMADVNTWQEWRKTEKQAAIDKAAAVLGGLTKSLRLDLPAGQQASIPENLTPFLESSSSYDPKSFQKLLQEAAAKSGRKATK